MREHHHRVPAPAHCSRPLAGQGQHAYRLLAWGTMPLGAAAGGLLAQWLGLQAMFGIMGVLTLALLGMMPILTDQAIAAADVES